MDTTKPKSNKAYKPIKPVNLIRLIRMPNGTLVREGDESLESLRQIANDMR